MQACTYANLTAGAFYVALSSFAACGGSQAPASSPSPEPAASAAPSDTTTPVASASSAPASSPSRAASPPAGPPQAPDRNMDDIRAVVAGNRDAFRACYDKSLKTHPGIKGRFLLKFVVSPDGAVKSAESDVAKSEIHASDLESCAVGVLRGLK